MKEKRTKRGGTGRPAGAGPAKVEWVGLDSLEQGQDSSEVPDSVSEEPGQDSPADDAVLDQEEQYQGISSETLPSSKVKEP